MIYSILYLVSITLANLLVTILGPAFSPINAFLFIGFDITLRDKLHESWHGKYLLPKMLGIILLGGIISYLLNYKALPIAIASTVAFLVSALLDFIVYQLLYRTKFLIKSNISNIASSISDSFIFPTLAFGSFMPEITALQIVAKLAGGFIWSFIINKFQDKKDANITKTI